MENILKKENNDDINNNKFMNTKKIVLELLNSYSYDDIIGYLVNEENEKSNIDLEIKLKKLVDYADIEELAKILNDEEIINYSNMTQIKINNNIEKTKNESTQSTLDSYLKLENDNLDINESKIQKRKERKKPQPTLSKVLYRKDNNIYIYRFISRKICNSIFLRCQDNNCKSKATYNYLTKELNIYENHSIPIEKHIYLTDKSTDTIKELVSYMDLNPQIKNVEVYNDSSKKIIDNIKQIKNSEKTNSDLNEINDSSMLFLNKKRHNSIKFFIEKFKHKKIVLFKSIKKKNKIKIRKNNSKKFLVKSIDKLDNINQNEVNNNEKIINIEEKEEETENNIKFHINNINKNEVFIIVKDKYLKHKQLLTEIEQKIIGENKRFGTHFHKNEKGEVYNFFGNNKEIKDFNMNYRCTLKGCKSSAIYNLNLREFKILREHTKPYEEHFCFKPNKIKTKQIVEYLRNNKNITDLQIILI